MKFIFFKILFTLLALICVSCGDNKPVQFYTFPEFHVKNGTSRSFDLSKYLDGSKKIIAFRNENNHKLSNNILTIDGANTDQAFEVVRLLIDKNKVDIVVRYLPMVKHKFIFKSPERQDVFIMGSFNDWSRNSLKMERVNKELFILEINLEPQKYEYKYIVNGNEILDPLNDNTVSNNIGGWNSMIDLSKKNQGYSTQVLKKKAINNELSFEYVENNKITNPDNYIVLFNNVQQPDSLIRISALDEIIVNTSDFSDGTVRVYVENSNGSYTDENRTIISSGSPLGVKKDSWYFTIIYNVLVDRFFDGNEQNNKKINDPRLHELANFHGGDIQGISKKIEEGYFKDLGINSLWISPIQQQPDSSYIEYVEPNRSFSGYHGYWPIDSRKIDHRFGNENEFIKMVENAHGDSVKVLLDFVSNHVHQNHIYFQNNKEWFGDFYLPDGTPNIRLWDGGTMLTTWFDKFLPSFDFSNSLEAISQVSSDAIWWINKYDIDGFRQDAVKHVPHAFWRKLTEQIKLNFPEKDFYQIGETFGSDELIGAYVNPLELNAQFNFSIYFNVRSLFSSSNTDFKDIDKTIYKNSKSFGPIHLMGNITSSHDQLRFSSYADGQISFDEDGISRAFNSPVKKIQNLSTYMKLANFHAFNSSQPGVPIIYYGEEIGMIGEQDPGNRRPMNFNLNENEKNLFNHFKIINNARVTYPSLALGDQTIIKSEGPVFITLKSYFDEKIIIAINNGPKTQIEDITLSRNCKTASNIMNEEEVLCNNNSFRLKLKPYSYVYYLVN